MVRDALGNTISDGDVVAISLATNQIITKIVKVEEPSIFAVPKGPGPHSLPPVTLLVQLSIPAGQSSPGILNGVLKLAQEAKVTNA